MIGLVWLSVLMSKRLVLLTILRAAAGLRVRRRRVLVIGIAVLRALRSSSIGARTCRTAYIGMNRLNWQLTARLMHCSVRLASEFGRKCCNRSFTNICGLVTEVSVTIVVRLGLLDVVNR